MKTTSARRNRTKVHSTQLLPPGPAAPAAWQLLRYSQSPLSFLEECARRYGDPFTLRCAGYGTFVMLSDPNAVRDVFRGSSDILYSGEGNAFLSVALGANSVLILDGKPHARQRRVLLPPLKGERMRSFFSPMQAATLDAVYAWPVGRIQPMLETMQKITLGVMLKVVLGLQSTDELTLIADQIQRMMAMGRGRHGLIMVKLLPVALLQRTKCLPFFRRMQDLDRSLFALIERQRRVPRAEAGESVLADLSSTMHEDGSRLSDQEIRDAVLTLLLSGHDTTAVALAWALEQIVPRPEVVQNIREELQMVTGGAPPDAAQLEKLEYLDAAIRESLRTRTILPFVLRVTKSDFTAGNRNYPAGIQLCPCNHLVHRREDLYPDPLAFRPERFLSRKYLSHEWFPFGGGHRMCIGTALAMYQMKVVLSTLFATARLSRPAGSRSLPIRRGIVLAPHDGTQLNVEASRS